MLRAFVSRHALL